MQFVEFASVDRVRSDLIELLIDSVDSGASVGFVSPLSEADAMHYWDGVDTDIEAGKRKIIIALDDGKVVGAVQLSITQKPNGLHRGEVEKLMVHSQSRGLGVAKRLMQTLEELALAIGRSLLVLDTRKGDIASTLYLNQGYILVGEIPGYALSANGQFDATCYFYKPLSSESLGRIS